MNFQRKRKELERLEIQVLAPYALKSASSRGRAHPEKESATRTAFQRDRDRIIHTTAFRRLEYKTQVFVFYEGDHYRTRLTHTLEVSQLGRSIARGLGANEDLTEAICLAHDLGHPPFGHAGETALNSLLKDYGGFNHNTQSYHIVTQLENRYPDFPGLNLTYETREGMLKHETEYDKSDAINYEPNKRASLEAQIANVADEIAYNAHDLEDGLRAGLFHHSELAPLELWQFLKDDIGWNGLSFTEITRRQLIRELIGLMVNDVVETSAANLEQKKLASADQLQDLNSNVVNYSPPLITQTRSLKDFLYERMYRHYRLMRMQTKAERFIKQIFEAYASEPKMLPDKIQYRMNSESLPQVIADYIAGMTDRFALEEWEKLFDPYSRA
ncbi:MAG: deoxyguanosinetriphosphate triphosphohydrolase [Anaerolineae bacterium]|nr:MAG: deoxyguanosinetriphosphate triphosphohydrolase [Anaerolineae bacterium]